MNEYCPVTKWESPSLLLAANHRSHSPCQTLTRRPVDSFSSQMIQAPSQCTREAGRKMGSSSRRRRRLLCTCSCNLKWHFAIVMAHASYVLFLLSVPACPRAAVISNGNYTRHFRRNWDLFRSLGTLRGAVTRAAMAIYGDRHESRGAQRPMQKWT